MMETKAHAIVVTPRTCSSCGRSFGAARREYVCSPCKKAASEARETSQKLSFRETQVVALVQQAKSNKEIAYELCLTVGTVKEYLYHIFRKLGVSNRTELALLAVMSGRGNVYYSKADVAS